MVKRWIIGIVVVSLLTVGLPAEPAAAQGGEPRFEPSACWPQASLPQIECGYVIVPEDRAPEGTPRDDRTIRIAVAVVRARGGAPDPVMFLQGGPGGASIADFSLALGPVLAQTLNRDVVFIDQRGTGFSQPALNCQEAIELTYELLDRQLTPQESADLSVTALNQCRDRLIQEGVNLAAYSNLNNASDIDAVRAALGYEQMNLYGVSYGTTLALSVMRAYPSRVRSVILDSVAAPPTDQLTEGLETTARVLQELYRVCAEQTRCQAAYPDLEQTLYATVAQLNANPAFINVTHPRTGQTYRVLVDGNTFVSQIITAFYVTPLIPSIPAMIKAASEGDFSVLQDLMDITLFAFEDIALGMFYAVVCGADYTPARATEAEQRAGAQPEAFREAQLISTLASIRICQAWNLPAPASPENEPVTSDIPTLLLSGQFDPVTPESFAASAAETLSNAYSYTFPGIGHGVSFSDPCAFSLVIGFLRTPGRQPDDACVRRVQVPPFVVR